MKLYHRTDEAAAKGIMEGGFGLSHVKDSSGKSWFSANPKRHNPDGMGLNFLITVEMPDEVAERHRYFFKDALRI
jgi:hypothetical protein